MKPYTFNDVNCDLWIAHNMCASETRIQAWQIAFDGADVGFTRGPLLAGLATLEVALPAAAEGAVAAAAVDDGLPADEEIGDAL